MPVEICNLENDETMITRGGALYWMSPNIKMATTSGGGISKSLGRMFAGENLLQNKYTAQVNGMIAFESIFPCKIVPFVIEPGKEYIFQKRHLSQDKIA